MVDDIKDFIIMHFKTAGREDTPFWKANRYETKTPDSLQSIFDRYHAGLPIKMPQYNNENLYLSFATQFDNFWTNTNYLSIMCGVDYLPHNTLPLLNYRSDILKKGEAILQQIKEEAKHFSKTLPSHYDYLKQMYSKQSPNEMKTQAECIS